MSGKKFAVRRAADPALLISFAEAEAIGVAVHDRWVKLGVAPVLTRDDLGWGDLVQFIVREANAAVAARGAGGAAPVDAAGYAEDL